ncbi:THUMP domain-containing protein [Methanofervidicoccus abyssi]|uniref:tRNA (guanine(10)-N(2))-dimethyltransferase n=1 Tax=Methanofervidicoccus abyssi TaxID=2082189 RepID=A0A401HQH8_9EURY|nr:THUMP domain-containing protein [Methanofervidicoccus abyssi]GBF36516.1 tRNA (guanine10-N2)-dimethyltransferase [Methanofervidicoccus abyssi]
MEAGFLLLKEHETLPVSELKALLEIYPLGGKVEVLNNYGTVSSSLDKPTLVKYINRIIERGAYIEEGHLIVTGVKYSRSLKEGLEKLLKRLEEFSSEELFNFLQIDPSRDTFAVRTVKINGNGDISSPTIERIVGGVLKEKTGAKVNLKEPSKVIKVVILQNKIYLGLLVRKRDRKYFYNNRPHLRTYFHPGSILPKLARGMVNLARLKEGEIILDPFCGVGGFLIEGGMIGCKLIGCDIDGRMVRGTLINLKSYNLEDSVLEIKRMDAKDVVDYLRSKGINSVDAIVTDPPYGILTSVKGDIISILEKLGDILKDGGYMVFAFPRKVDLNLKLMEIHKLYVHGSLTRHIHVYKKESTS